MSKTLVRQLVTLCAVGLAFLLFDLAIYTVFTERCIHRYGEDMQAKSIELDAYLPFTEPSLVVRIDGAEKLNGELPVIDGAAALYPVFSATVYALYPASSVVFDGTDFAPESALQYSNTRGAYRGIVDGTVDIAFCVAPSAEQLAYAEEKGVALMFTPIGREAFVFLVNDRNAVDTLTTEQVRGIYSGAYTNWSQVGGENRPIAALQRNAGSGSQSALLNFMGDLPIKRDYDTFLGRAIGFSFRFYVEGIVEEGNVKMLALDCVYPSTENIKNGTYPIINELYAVTREGETNPNVQVILDWLLSEEGQRMIEETGYVGIS